MTSLRPHDSYLSLSSAKRALDDRKPLRQQVEAWWENQGWGQPPIPVAGATLARHVATFRYEDALFTLMAERAGLTPWWFEYIADSMTTASAFKLSLVKPVFCQGRGRKGGLKTTNPEVIPYFAETYRRSRLSDIVTVNGESLVDFHHRQQETCYGGAIRSDFSDWLKTIAGFDAHSERVRQLNSGLKPCVRAAPRYYAAYLSLFVAHSVLLEDYHGGESGNGLDKFTAGTFETAWRCVVDQFGVAPLIVKLPWIDELRYFPEDRNWRNHGVIPEELIP